jgi:hypothetical protein
MSVLEERLAVHKAQVVAAGVRWRDKNRDHLREKQRTYRSAHPPAFEVGEPCSGCALKALCREGVCCALWRNWVNTGGAQERLRGIRMLPLQAYYGREDALEHSALTKRRRGPRLASLPTEDPHETLTL